MKSIPSMSIKTKAMKSLGRKILCVLLAGVFFGDTIAWAEAPILPDTKAPGNRYPLVQETANGIPLVNISAPTAGGVSRNDYERFNVPAKGAILNNSYTLSQTELAGYVQGNANMAKGPAKIIVNQVTSANPTSMNGFLEVAGNKADVVIANPNGITVNGGGFINTGRAILTTGKPEYDSQERLQDLRIDNDSTILITGNGLNGKKTDTLELYTRAADIQAAIWGNTLQVTTGANTIDMTTGKVTAIEGKGKKPDVAIDVKALGGMYAGRIFLVANEKGLPIDLKGMIESQHMALDSKGNLYHTGITHVTENLEIHAKDIQNGGTLAAGTMTMTADGQITNDHILGSEGNMVVQAESIKNNKTIASEKDLSITTSSQEENALDNTKGEILANGNMTLIASHSNNQGGTIASGNTLQVKGDSLDNGQGKISSYGNANIQLSQNLNNKEGHIDSKQDIILQAGTIQNTKGTITAGQDETIETKDIQLDGKLASENDLSITTEADMTNENASEGYGITQADGNLSISTKGKLTNAKKLEAKGILTLRAKDMTNTTDGSINGGTVSVTVNDNIENKGLISADEENTITATTLKNTETGRIYGENITLQVDIVENRKNKELEEKLSTAMKELQQKGKELDAAYAVDVTAFTNSTEQQTYFRTIEEKQASYDTAKAAVDAILDEMKNLSSAAIAARGDLSIHGNTLLNSADALLYAGEDMTLEEKQSIMNNGADIKALGNLSLTAPTITNGNEAFSAKRVWTSHTTNPNRIRIDQQGHPEQGQVFNESEFSELGSGYGAYHNKGITPKELLEEAKYDKIEQITDEERKDGETPVPDNEVGKEAPNYDYDDPIFQEFGITSMSTPRPGYDDPQQATWDAQYKEILAQLNEKIRVYNEEAKAYNQSIGAIESVSIKNYTIIRSTTHTSEKQVQETRAATISSGKDMTLTGNITNENSRILAGSTLTATGGILENEAEQNQEQRITFGTTQESYTKKKHFPHKAWRRHYRDEIFMTPQEELENPTSLGVGQYEGTTGTAPTKEDITQAMRDNVQQNLNPFSTGKETNPGTTAGKETGGTLSFIPDNTLYKLHPEETAKYLVETDPAFTNKKKFLSSDYMYQQMLWDPDKMTKRLGDGFYEQELIRNQVSQLTGMRYLTGYTTDEEEYKALMDAGIAYAKEYNLTPGIPLSKEQMASLTSDMVWMETTTVTVNGKTYKVLYPHVYLKAGSEKTLTNQGTIISANTLLTDTKNKLANEGTLKGNTILAKGHTLVNHGTIFGDTIHLKAEQDIEHSGIIEGENNVTLEAGRNITMTDTLRHGKNQDILDTTAGIAVKGKEGVLLMEAGETMSLTGATLSALGEEGSMILRAGKNLTMDTDSLEAKKDMTENKDNYIRTYRKTETANTLTAGKDITLTAGDTLHARNTTIASEEGAITAKAGTDLVFENGYNETKDDYGLQYKESGFLSHKTTTVKSHDETKTATGSLVSGDTVQLEAGHTTTIKGSSIVGTHDVTMTSGEDTTIESAEEKEQHTYDKQVKKSGLMGSGVGFTIGKEKRNDQYQEADTLQKASTVGSLQGNVTVNANKDIHVDASDIMAGKDISMTGENVTITSKDNVYHNDEKHEYKKSGLTVSVGGATIDAIQQVVEPITKASQVKDKRLAGLYAVKAEQEIDKQAKNYQDQKAAGTTKDNQLGGKNTFTLNVGLGSSHSKAESHSETTVAQGSRIQASGDVTIKATKEDIQIKGSQVSGENVNLQAKKDITISAAENSNKTTEETKSSGSSIGASIGIGGLQGIQASYSKSKGNVKENATTYEKSDIQANKDLTFTSGKDTTITGSTMEGNKVTGNVGGNLSIETKQERNTYEEKNTSAGVSMNYGVKDRKTSLSGGASRGNAKSNYESAKDQAGIIAGQEGYDITVKANTHLKGGLIDSDADKEKNTLITGTLTWEDIVNKADYKAGGAGISYIPKDSTKELNQKGLTPSMTPTVKGKADSTTKSAVADGTIRITDKEHQKQDVSTLNRDTKNALNQLEDIFDKTKVEEKQELVGILEKYGNQAIHRYAESKGWEDGSSEKMLLHGAFGALMGDMAGGSAASGALSGSVNEYVTGYLTKTKGQDWVQKHPDTVQWISAGVGAAIGASVKDMATGADVSLDASKWNYLGFGMDTTPLLKRTLKSKTGQALSEEEWNEIHFDLMRIAAEADSFGAESDQLEIGNETAKQNVRNYLVGKGFTIDSTEEFINGYDSWGRDLQKRMNSIPKFKKLPQVTVAASKIKDGASDIPDVAWDKSKDILMSTGLSWGVANWYEAEYGYLSRKEAEQIGQEMSNATMKAWGNIAYLKEVCENHKRYNSFENELRADGYDTLPISVGIVTSSILATRGSYIQFMGVGVTGTVATWYAKNKKETLSKNAPNVDNQENRGE